ncbi:MAG: hypothetical protein Q8L29_01095 [archaeon]|nr:hypothetical protein [archaeon]
MKNGQTLENEKTEKVGGKKNYRDLYVEFLELVNSRGIGLNNHFKGIWASNPEKYLISNSDEDR